MHLTRNFSAKLEAINQQLKTDFGIISFINGEDYQVLEVSSDFHTIQPGDHFVTKDTYCNQVVNSDKPVIYEKVGKIRALILHPIYRAMQLEAYIGVPLHKNRQIVGTLNFSGFDPKLDGFSEQDIAAVEDLAKEIELALEH